MVFPTGYTPWKCFCDYPSGWKGWTTGVMLAAQSYGCEMKHSENETAKTNQKQAASKTVLGSTQELCEALVVFVFQNCLWKLPFFLKENGLCCLSQMLWESFEFDWWLGLWSPTPGWRGVAQLHTPCIGHPLILTTSVCHFNALGNLTTRDWTELIRKNWRPMVGAPPHPQEVQQEPINLFCLTIEIVLGMLRHCQLRS